MDKSQMRVRPGFLLGLVVSFAILCWIIISGGVATEKDKTKARILQTRVEERLMANLLGEQAINIGGLTNINNEFVLNSLINTNAHQFSFASHTNASGEAVDIWDTPYRIELVGRTNFIISSAGKNRKFGDKDDIIFNSVSHDFVNP